jgi:hypothetical protein
LSNFDHNKEENPMFTMRPFIIYNLLFAALGYMLLHDSYEALKVFFTFGPSSVAGEFNKVIDFIIIMNLTINAAFYLYFDYVKLFIINIILAIVLAAVRGIFAFSDMLYELGADEFQVLYEDVFYQGISIFRYGMVFVISISLIFAVYQLIKMLIKPK